MKTRLSFLLVAAAGLTALGAQAQVATPSSPAPVIETQTAPQAATQTVYTPRLPSAAELTNAASAQGLTVDRIVQTESQMTVTYRSTNGQTNTVAYMMLPAAGAPASTVQATTVVAAPAPATRVVYAEAAPIYYYDPFYYPAYYNPWYAPVSVSLGFGYRGGWHGGYRGGYHGGHGGHRWR